MKAKWKAELDAVFSGKQSRVSHLIENLNLFKSATDRSRQDMQVLHLQPEDHEALHQYAVALAGLEPVSREAEIMGKGVVICRCAMPLKRA